MAPAPGPVYTPLGTLCASLLAKAVRHPMQMLTDITLSRAGSLPQGLIDQWEIAYGY